MLTLARPRRPRRSGDWTADKAVTFIVTLAAGRSVTLAALEAGMSRKAAYALKRRDPSFASAWRAALDAPGAAAAGRRQGNEVEEVHDTPFSLGQGNSPGLQRGRTFDGEMRGLVFGRLANRRAAAARIAPLARSGALA